MQLRRRVLKLTGTDTSIRVVMPEADDAPSPESEVVEIDFLGVKRKISGAVLRMALKFNSEHRERTALLHDCATFVVACITGDCQSGVLREESSLPLVDLTEGEDASGYPEGIELRPRQATVIHRRDDEGNFVAGSHHYMMPASVDGQTPSIYASKIAEYPVYLHTFGDMVSLFGANTVRAASFAVHSAANVS
jgi:hypothetical protein